MQYEIKCVRVGEEQPLLDEGYEPFGVVSHDTSYWFYNTGTQQKELERRATDYIYLRKRIKKCLTA